MYGLSPEVLQKLILSVGTHRSKRPLMPVEVAEAINAALASGTTRQELADALHLEYPTMVGRFVRLLKLPPEIRHLVDWGQGQSAISFAVASEIELLASNNEQWEVAEATLKHRLAKVEVRQIVQIRQRSGKPVSECVAEVIRMRPRIERRHLIVGSVLSNRMQTVLQQMTQDKRDELLKNAIVSQNPELPPWGGRLGVEKFTLLGDEAFSAAVQRLPGGFEQAINTYLEAEVARRESCAD